MASSARAMVRRQAGVTFSSESSPSLTADGDLLRPRGMEIGTTPAPILTRNPDRVEAWLFNAGGNLELPIDLGAGDRTQAALPLAAFIDSAAVAAAQYAPSTFKSLMLIVDTAIVYAGAGQATISLVVGRDRWAASSGGASNIGGTQNNAKKGAAANLGGNVASLAAGIYPFSPADLADLQWQWAFIGAELAFPVGAITAGSARLVLAMPGGPPVLLGTDEQMSGNTGDRANSFVLMPASPPFRVTSRRALFARTLAGNADLRVWETVATKPQAVEVGAEP